MARSGAEDFFNLLHALGGLAYLPGRRKVKSGNPGPNVLAVKRDLIGDVNQLRRDDPANAAGHANRNDNRDKYGSDAAGVQFLEASHHRSQQKRQRERECQRGSEFRGQSTVPR